MRTLLHAGSLFLSLLLSSGLQSNAQDLGNRFEHLTIVEGLLNNSVSAIIQDQKGYMWFGTYEGLNKFDGYSFTTFEYAPQDTTSLIQNSIFSLWEDSDGFIWVGTAESGISKFDRASGKFTNYRPEQDTSTFIPPFRAVSAFNEDSEGYLWVGNWLGELRRFDKKSGEFLPEQFNLQYNQKRVNLGNTDQATLPPDRDAIYCIYKDRSGTLWVGNNSGLHQINLSRGKQNQRSTVNMTHYRHEPDKPNSLSSDYVTAVFEDKDGLLWIGTYGGGLNRFDRKTNSFTRYLHDPGNLSSLSSNTVTPNTIIEDLAGNLWIGTDKGLNKLNNERTSFTSYTHHPDDPTSISSNYVYSLFLDDAGTLWVGSSSLGISKVDLREKPFNHYRHRPEDASTISQNTVTCLSGSEGDTIWIATLGGGLNAFDKKTGKFRHYRHGHGNKAGIRSDSIYDISESPDGGLWIRSSSYLSFYRPETGTFKHYPYNRVLYRALNADSVVTMYTDRQGLLWLGTHNGVKSFDRYTEKITHYRHDLKNPDGLSDHVVNAILQDREGYIWMGHGSVGLSKLNKKTGMFSHYMPDPSDSTSLSTSIVYSIFQDSKGILWFGTSGGGLCGFDPQKEVFTTYSKKDGLSDNTVYSILEDDNHHLWLGTGRGLSRFTAASNTFLNYDLGDGMPSGIDSGVSLKGADGTLYYGGKNGLTAFDPTQIRLNRYVPPVVITEFRLFDKLMPGKEEAKEIILKHDENFFSFEFSALNYTNSYKNKYAYLLEGIDKGWVYSGTRRVASYTDIAPGVYIFRVKGSNNDGIWNNEGVSMRIVIQPPWWRSWWAYAFYTLCLVAVVLAVDRSQRTRLIQKEREKARERELAQAREIEKAYHELKQTQAQLVQKEKMASLGELTAGIAHEIQNPLNFVNNFSEVNTELVLELKEALSAGKKAEAISIAGFILDNEQKIKLHGKRADAIVKGMLQHARTSTGEKHLTDVNALIEEHLRLAYHGIKAQNKGFTCKLDTYFDRNLEMVIVAPQELGRVLLNLFHNAFYAVQQKQKLGLGQAKADEEVYEPTLSVGTRQLEGRVAIWVRDNGTGMPVSVKSKVFQPFFTTKPTGQGTGLGLSLSYDIITKGHGGEMSVTSEEGEWTEFIISLPHVPVAEQQPAASTAPPLSADTYPQQ